MPDLQIFKPSLRREVPPQLFAWLDQAAIDAGLDARFTQEADRTNDPSFGQRFFEGCPVADCSPKDYQQRVLHFDGGHVWTGIRFLGGDVDSPFVDIIASTVPLHHASQWGRLVAGLRSSYANFRPRAIRVFVSQRSDALQLPSVEPPLRTTVDQLLLAGSVDALVLQPEPPISRRVRLDLTAGAEGTAELVARAYEEFHEEHPALAQAVTPATADDLAECARTGLLATIVVDEKPAGVIATRRDLAPHFYGQCVVEQVLDRRHRGRGFAAAAQRRCIEALERRYPGAVIWGSIDARNSASIATARRAGRKTVGAWCWVTPAER